MRQRGTRRTLGHESADENSARSEIPPELLDMATGGMTLNNETKKVKNADTNGLVSGRMDVAA